MERNATADLKLAIEYVSIGAQAGPGIGVQ